MEKKMRVAIPSDGPGGLSAARADHFGHCPLFTLVEIEAGQVAGVETVANVAHGTGGCLGPVAMLKQQGVDALVVGGMGARPLAGCAEAGIKVYFAASEAFVGVKAAVEGLLGGQCVAMEPAQACQGHGNCHGHGPGQGHGHGHGHGHSHGHG